MAAVKVTFSITSLCNCSPEDREQSSPSLSASMAAAARLLLALLLTAPHCYGEEDDEELVEEIHGDCLRCICQAVSKCDVAPKCTRGGATCGPFRISWPFWADAGKPVPPDTEADSTEAFKACAFDFECASSAVKKYMEGALQDCNGDKKIDCLDYALMFRLGKYGCNGSLDATFGKKFTECRNSTSLA